jgi:hypothetical protein
MSAADLCRLRMKSTGSQCPFPRRRSLHGTDFFGLMALLGLQCSIVKMLDHGRRSIWVGGKGV